MCSKNVKTNIFNRSPINVAPMLSRQKSAITAASPMFNRKFDVNAPTNAVPQSPRMIRRQLSNKASPGL